VNVHGSNFAGRVGWGASPAVVVVDVVRGYVEPEGPFWLGVPEVVDRCAALVDAARAGGRPVFWTVVRYAPGASDAGWFAAKVPALAHFAVDADGGWGEIATGLSPSPDEPLVVKQHASAFAGTSLASTLTSRGVDTVVVAPVCHTLPP